MLSQQGSAARDQRRPRHPERRARHRHAARDGVSYLDEEAPVPQLRRLQQVTRRRDVAVGVTVPLGQSVDLLLGVL